MTILARLFIALGLLVPAFVSAATGALTVTTLSLAGQDVSVPQGAQRVPLLQVTLAATCAADVSVTELVVRHAGLGSARDLARLYLMEDGARLSRGVVPSDRNASILRLRSFTVPACGSRTISVAADVSASASPAGEHRLVLESVTADASVSISAAATSPASPATVTPSISSPQVSAEFLDVHTSQLYGANRVLARVRLQNDGRRAVLLTAITITNDGKARNADLQNMALFASRGTAITAEAGQLEGDRLRLVFDSGFVLESGDEKVLELRGDVRASRRQTIDFMIEEPSDIEAVEARTR